MPTVPTYEQEVVARQFLVARIRERCRDYADLNRLVEGQEHSDRMIHHAIGDILDDFNTTPPFIGVWYAHNIPSINFLIDGVLSILLESAALLYTRNDLSYAHQGTQVAFNQGEAYLRISQMLRARYEQKAARWKVAQNMEMAVNNSGGLYSSFILTYRPYLGINNLTDYQGPRAGL